jgi:hypothetical protein
VLTDLRETRSSVVIGHSGGETLLGEIGTLRWQGSEGGPPVVFHEVFVVEPGGLPAGVVALLGVADIRLLGISLDAVMASPDHDWELAVPLSLFSNPLWRA